MESAQDQISAGRRTNPVLLLAVCLTVLVLGVYWTVQHHEFLLWDDYEYVVGNPHVRSGLSLQGIFWAFTSAHASNWHPLTWLSHMADCSLYGLNPSGHHWNNLLLHLANTVLLLFLFERMTRALWQSAFVAAVFALHPLHVESVAWVSERKDLLSTFFWLLTCLAYLRYTRKENGGAYVLCILLYALALASKPMPVTLPVILLLLDRWPLGRTRSLLSGILEKWPFFVLAALSSLLTIYVSRADQALAPLEALSLQMRIQNAFVSYATYLIKSFCPFDLAFFYPHPLGTLPAWKIAGSVISFAFVSVVSFGWRKKRPYLLIGWLWFGITLLPVIGLFQVGSQAMADRYTYVPLIGISVMVAWGAADVLKGWRRRRAVFAFACGMVLFLLSFRTSAEIRYWRDGETLFERALEVTSGNYTAHYQLGNELMRKGRLDSAVYHFSEAVRFRPDHFLAHHNLGIALTSLGRLDEALGHYRAALSIQPGNAGILSSIGDLYLMQGGFDQAISSYAEALRMDPSLWRVQENMGTAFLRKGMAAEAVVHFEEALKIHPGDQKAERNLHLARQKLQESGQ